MERIIPKFKCLKKDGWIEFCDPEKVRYFLNTIPETFYVTVTKEPKEPRSVQQNRYYWGVPIKIISEELGCSEEDTHDYLRNEFLTKRIFVKIKGKTHERKIDRSTTSLKTDEFEEYLDKIKAWASMELGVFIPDPEKVEI